MKVKAKLLDPKDTMFAVLAPGIGYLKFDLGNYTLHDKMPRASGCFATHEEAESARDKAVAWMKKNLGHFYDKKEAQQAAHTAIVVKMSIERV